MKNYENKAPVLLVGNGLSRSFGADEWKKFIKSSAEEFHSKYPYDKIESLPCNMSIVAATNDSVDKCMKDFAQTLHADISGDSKRINFLRQFLCMPGMDIITSNYSLELEQAGGIPNKLNKYYACRKDTQDCTEREKKLRLYTYFDIPDYEKRVWHIHGDITTPSSLVMGHYYYGKVLHEIQNYVPKLIRRQKAAEKAGEPLEIKSWVDLFLTREVHIIGMKMDISEIDLWWLICCKKRNFPDTKVHFYEPNFQEVTPTIMLLEAYNVDICKDIFLKNGDYLDYYNQVLNKIICNE